MTHEEYMRQALELAKKYPRTLVLGGASVFKQFLPFLDTIHVTEESKDEVILSFSLV